MVVNLSPVRTDSVYWLQVPTGNDLLRAAIATPTGPGPFPAVVMLHGTHGFVEEYVRLIETRIFEVSSGKKLTVV